MLIFRNDFAVREVRRNMWSKVKGSVKSRVTRIRKTGPTSCLCITAMLCLIPLIVIALVIKFNIPTSEYYVVYIDTQDEALFSVNERFLSIGLDSTIITDGFPNFNMSDPKLIKMIQHLSPAYLRIGGNQADQIVFRRNNNNSTNVSYPDSYSLWGKQKLGFTNMQVLQFNKFAASDWLKLYNLSRAANVDIIYDLNSLLRHENGSWNYENAQQMLKFSESNNLMVDWELGNEPNSYFHKFNTLVNATQLGLDFHTARSLLNNYTLYQNASLIGPSTTRLRTKEIEEYFYDFLASGSEAVSAITFHHYYFSGINATWEEFLLPENFDYLEYCIDTVKSVIELLPDVNRPIWLGETSTAWHGGAPNMSDRFIGSFLWIDKLGLSAKMGVDLVVRQSIFKDSYALLNDSYYPNPDWWISVLYKKLVGSKIITTETEGDANVRLYVHCAKQNPLWPNGSSVIVFGVNLNNKNGLVQIKELRSDSIAYEYEIRANGTLYSQYVQLNGEQLVLLNNMELPDFKPVPVERKEVMEINPLSIIFWVFTNTNLDACAP